jgi:calmodulin
MAIKQIKSTCGYMTMEEFKEWLKQLDTNKDGQLSREELRKALRKRGVGRVTAFRSIHRADKDRNGFIDEAEVENLISLAQKSFGIRVWS